MSNYADPSATRTVLFDEWRDRQPDKDPIRDLPSCRCPGTPHQRDSATVVVRLGYGAKGAVREATRRGGIEAGHLVLILRAVRSWNLVVPDGSARPLDGQQVELLDDQTVQWLLEELDQAWEDDALPNASSAPSPDGSPGSAGPIQTTPTTTETSPDSTST